MKSENNPEREIELWKQAIKEHFYGLQSGFTIIAESRSPENQFQKEGRIKP